MLEFSIISRFELPEGETMFYVVGNSKFTCFAVQDHKLIKNKDVVHLPNIIRPLTI